MPISNGLRRRQLVAIIQGNHRDPQIIGGMGEAVPPAAVLAVQQFVLKLGVDVLFQLALLRVKARHTGNQPEGKLLVHVVAIQMSGANQGVVLPDYPVDAVEMFLYDTVALGDRVIVFHNVILSVFWGSRSGNGPGPSPP